ncbi:MAG: hypothetical protein J5601_01950, partial [Elusimicrobiaceae bacterium]|nr:hypothetical protein [Elusimicrobiaceae bacterium]
MKKLITIIFILLISLSTMVANAQPNKNEIALEYSYFSVPQGVYLFGGIMGVAFSLGHFDFGNTIMTGALGVEYTRNVNDWFSYGGLATAEYMTSDTFTTDENGNRVKNGTFNLGATTLLPTAHFTWFRHD